MLAFLMALMLCTATLIGLRAGLAGLSRVTIVGFDAQGLGLGILAVLAAAYFFGPLFGFALMLSVAIHEFGHVVAFRLIGHDDARFRLIPLGGGVAISDRLPRTQLQDFFVSLMGPGLCIAPMVLAYTLSDLTHDAAPMVSHFLWVFAMATAGLNIVNLLPFWPLDGGRCTRILVSSFAPRMAMPVTITMSASFAAVALYQHSTMLLIFALIGAQSVLRADVLARSQRPMPKRHALLALAAYLATAATHLYAGWWFLSAWS